MKDILTSMKLVWVLHRTEKYVVQTSWRRRKRVLGTVKKSGRPMLGCSWRRKQIVSAGADADGRGGI